MTKETGAHTLRDWPIPCVLSLFFPVVGVPPCIGTLRGLPLPLFGGGASIKPYKPDGVFYKNGRLSSSTLRQYDKGG